MAMVRKCDLCPKIEGVQHYTVRWDDGNGSADLCPDHGSIITEHLQQERVGRRPVAGRGTGARRGPGLAKVTTVEDIEKQKAGKK